MNYVPKFLILMLLLPFFESCKKDDVALLNQDDSFINSREYLFRGTMPDSSVLWKYGVYEFQRGTGTIPLVIGEQAQKSLSFALVSNEDLSTRVEMTTPSYAVFSDELFSRVLVQGTKEIGARYNKFELALTLNQKIYTTNGEQTNSSLVILKTEKSKDEFGNDIVLVWFKVNCRFYSTVDATSFTLENGYFLTGFMYNF